MEKLFTLALLGLLGSAGHCVGMCGPVTLLFTRPAREAKQPLGLWLALLHAGRLTMYGTLAATVTVVGQAAGRSLPGLHALQGALALLVALVLLYMALATLGYVPPLESAWPKLTAWWGQTVRRRVARPEPRLYHALGLGLLWGLLPCGLVYSAVIISATLGHPLWAAGGMGVFGVGTLPLVAGLGWSGTRIDVTRRQALRHAAAAAIFLFGVQMALRGLAAWGWIGHARVGEVMLW